MLIRFCLLWNEAFVLLPQLPKLLLHFLYTPEVRWDVGIIARPKTSAQLDQMDRNSIRTRSRIGCNCLNGVGSFDSHCVTCAQNAQNAQNAEIGPNWNVS